MKWIGVLGLVAVFLFPAWAGSIPQKERMDNEVGRAMPRNGGCLMEGYYMLNVDETICVSSPGYPSNYPNNANLLLQLDNIDPSGQLYVSCEELSIQKSKKCKKDSLTINNSGTVKIYCGKRKPFTFTTDSYWIDFHFESDKMINFKGFICNVTALAGDGMGMTTDPAPTHDPTLVSECECGRAKNISRITDGQVNPQKFNCPWLVGLYQGDSKDPFCGGVIYTLEWTITAAHCVNHLAHGAELTVVAGSNTIGEGTRAKVTRIIIHPEYDRVFQFSNDIALLYVVQLERAIPSFHPVCMPDKLDNFEGKEATVTGWGLRWAEGDKPNTAYYVKIKIRSAEECKESWSNTNFDKRICAGSDDYNKGICQGDSGGPLTVEKNGRLVLAGIVSFNYNRMCGLYHYYDIYTSVPKYVEWIHKETKTQSCTP